MTNKKIGKGKIAVLIICIIVFLVSFTVVVTTLYGSYNNKKTYNELSDSVKTEDLNSVFYDVYKRNNDFVGWVTVPNTGISHPVFKTDNNNFYLYNNLDKKRDKHGAIFMDYRNNAVNFDANTVLYGHNCYDNTMFSELIKYRDIDFYKSSPVIEFDTFAQKKQWKIYAVFITTAKADEDNGYVFNYIYPFMDGENFDGYINEINLRRLYVTDVDINKDDKLLTLSTCIRDLDLYKNGVRTYRADGRIVVVARMVRENEDAYVDTDKAYLNAEPKYPQIWYDKKEKVNPYADDEKWYPWKAVE